MTRLCEWREGGGDGQAEAAGAAASSGSAAGDAMEVESEAAEGGPLVPGDDVWVWLEGRWDGPAVVVAAHGDGTCSVAGGEYEGRHAVCTLRRKSAVEAAAPTEGEVCSTAAAAAEEEEAEAEEEEEADGAAAAGAQVAAVAAALAVGSLNVQEACAALARLGGGSGDGMSLLELRRANSRKQPTSKTCNAPSARSTRSTPACLREWAI